VAFCPRQKIYGVQKTANLMAIRELRRLAGSSSMLREPDFRLRIEIGRGFPLQFASKNHPGGISSLVNKNQ
jgi:hypothetical protein